MRERWHCAFGERTGLKLGYFRIKTLEMAVGVIKGNEQSIVRERKRKKKRIRN